MTNTEATATRDLIAQPLSTGIGLGISSQTAMTSTRFTGASIDTSRLLVDYRVETSHTLHG